MAVFNLIYIQKYQLGFYLDNIWSFGHREQTENQSFLLVHINPFQNTHKHIDIVLQEFARTYVIGPPKGPQIQSGCMTKNRVKLFQ